MDTNRYMVLGTADAAGLPWVSPVWYAPAAYREFFWVSSPETRHSRNLATRPQLGIVIFDSQARISTGQGVYMTAVADEVTGDDLDRGIAIFSRRSEAQGARPWTKTEVSAPAPLRLYRATPSEIFVLGPGDQRIPVSLE